jgi:hypothetical protein
LALVETPPIYAAKRPTQAQLTSTLDEMRQVLAQFRDYWFADTLTAQDKKVRLRCLVEQVVVDGRGEMIRVQLHWYGGSVSELAVPKRLQTLAALYFRIQELAHTQTDQAIADQLNTEGYPTAYQRPWTARHVLTFRRFHAILSAFDADPDARLNHATYGWYPELCVNWRSTREQIAIYTIRGIPPNLRDGYGSKRTAWRQAG